EVPLGYDSIPARFSCNLPEKNLRNMSTIFNQCLLRFVDKAVFDSDIRFFKSLVFSKFFTESLNDIGDPRNLAFDHHIFLMAVLKNECRSDVV
ncbi:MAG: hypothetical protein IIZ07_02215, partial [Ruminococcus sp.]|nr:hypothetical protein [Ruminococcus sp.]